MATENIQKGWLYTREGEKFAPETLVENVTTRSGKPYDERVREYLNTLNTSLTQKINNIKTEVDSSGKDYDDAIKALQSKDSSHDSSIAALQSKDTQLDADITALENKLQYFDGSSSDKLFIVDNNNKVVAYVDGTGVHSVDFLIGTENKSIAEQLKWFDGSAGNQFFFIDDSENVVAYIDGNGIHSTEYTHKNGTTFSWVIEQLNTFNEKIIEYNSAISALQDKDREFAVVIPIIQNKDREQDERLSDLEDKDSEFEDKLQYLNYEEAPDAFYFIDSSSDKKVAAKIAGDGIDAVDFRAKGQDYSLVGLNAAVKANIENIGKNKTAIESNDTDILALQGRATELESRASALEGRTTAVEGLAAANQVAHNTMEDNLEEYYGYNNFGQDTFYFIDKSTDPRVGTMVNAAGITTTNITFANEKNAKENMMFFEKLGTVNITI